MSKDPRHSHNREPEWDITDEQVDDALERLFQTVKGEKVPAAWMKAEQDQAEQANTASIGADENTNPHANGVHAAPALRIVSIAEPSIEIGHAMKDARLAEPIAAGQLTNRIDAMPDSAAPAIKRKRHLKRRWMTGAVAAVVAGVMLFSSWGQDVMASMINTFRVQHFESVSITESDLNGFREALQDGTVGTRQLDLRLYGEIEQSGGGTERAVGAEEAGKLAGRPLKLLPGADANAIAYMPKQEITFKLHPKEINKLLKLLGGKTAFPDEIDNAPIRITVPDSFTMDIRTNQDGSRSSKQFVQLQAPTLDVPDEVDVEQVRQAVLDLPVLPDELRTKLAAIGDWRHTLPVPSMAGESAKTMKIGGNDAIVSTSNNNRAIVWLQDGWLYTLNGSLSDYPAENDIIKEAEGLMKA
ncbi:hypothetical protein GZH47_10565 [Paenibacillus rhizovicinus]|uniref:DUF4367 domain-containing protein n=1 Tax=Paenibacillus rhizovicinus TaxID=2704463 RepID=A0A6C0NYF7_9BACL|nr:hypothetical protein [Paenibacillus rhizovicinus]QHW31257.1 hypothetical protein GZH47_10565 [Paenibacillus rhizovicinus]